MGSTFFRITSMTTATRQRHERETTHKPPSIWLFGNVLETVDNDVIGAVLLEPVVRGTKPRTVQLPRVCTIRPKLLTKKQKRPQRLCCGLFVIVDCVVRPARIAPAEQPSHVTHTWRGGVPAPRFSP